MIRWNELTEVARDRHAVVDRYRTATDLCARRVQGQHRSLGDNPFRAASTCKYLLCWCSRYGNRCARADAKAALVAQRRRDRAQNGNRFALFLGSPRIVLLTIRLRLGQHFRKSIKPSCKIGRCSRPNHAGTSWRKVRSPSAFRVMRHRFMRGVLDRLVREESHGNLQL